jgi:acid stress-induced BolA-like protein IbaG/YrbA
MFDHPTAFQGNIIEAIRSAIEEALPDSRAQVTGAGGHFSIEVISPVFAGKGVLESQRLVYSAIGHLMKGDMAPVHAVDSLRTKTPSR